MSSNLLPVISSTAYIVISSSEWTVRNEWYATGLGCFLFLTSILEDLESVVGTQTEVYLLASADDCSA